jgi:hypothetical protein
MHPALAEAVARNRLAEAQSQASAPTRGRTPRRRSHTLRRATGWFLVSTGLRLALPRHITRAAQ